LFIDIQIRSVAKKNLEILFKTGFLEKKALFHKQVVWLIL